MEGAIPKSMLLCWTRSLTAHTIAAGENQNQKGWENKKSGGFWQKNKIQNKKWTKAMTASKSGSSGGPSQLCKENHFQSIPQRRHTDGTTAALLLLQEHWVFFWHRASQTAVTSLFLLSFTFYMQFMVPFFFSCKFP